MNRHDHHTAQEIMRLEKLVFWMRQAQWLTPARARAYATVMLALMCLAVGVGVVLGGSKLAYDFRSFWAASSLALQGHPSGAYRPLEHYAVEATTPGFERGGWVAFFYPPIFLLICLPLALLPFWWSALAWVGLGGACLVAAVRPVIPHVASAWLIALSFPAAWLCAAGGQSAILIAALFTLAARSLDRRPALAGLCFGLVAMKPQLGLVVPFALIAARRWRTAAVAAITVLGLMALSVAQFGFSVWRDFVDNLANARVALEVGDELAINIPTVGGAALLFGASPAVSGILQLMFALVVLSGLVTLVRRRPGGAVEGAAICVAAVLCSPWTHFYDLAILAFPIAWLVGR